MIKIIHKSFTYFESEEKYELKINDKEVVAFKYEKTDPQFSDYEVTVTIQNEEDLSEEEIEEIKETIKEEL